MGRYSCAAADVSTAGLRACTDAGVPGPFETRRMRMVLLSIALYFLLLRRPVLTWGARDITGALPGDELLPDADGVATRAVWIDAPPAAVWPWIAQMGPAPRGGAYTYDWIENLLGLNMHSVDEVLPEFQHPVVGDVIGFGPNQMRLERVDVERVLAWRSSDGNWVWTFVLVEERGGTRLISRNRFRRPQYDWVRTSAARWKPSARTSSRSG